MRYLRRKIISFALCVAMVLTLMPLQAFADDFEDGIEQVTSDFEGEELLYESANAAAEEALTGVVLNNENPPIGNEPVGSLKILARYNDSMKFYDGHTYLLFTSYYDGLEITIDDLFAGYQISEDYYTDLENEGISVGSNHTNPGETDEEKEAEAARYFRFDPDMKTAKLDRGQIVTIGNYRAFYPVELTIPQTALASIKNSSYWPKVVKAGKTDIVENIFRLIDEEKISLETAFVHLTAIFEEVTGGDFDYHELLDGVTEGGVCFNRELYNQKYSWDQYENVTFETEITLEQLENMVSTLGGNYNRFSTLSNSCATVAVNGWNAAVGEDSELALTSKGSGIFSILEAPKTVKEDIIEKMQGLPGFYLNNSNGGDPDAGYEDETGWVYVSAPAKHLEDNPVGTFSLETSVVNGDIAGALTDIISEEGGKLGSSEEIAAGTRIYIESSLLNQDDLENLSSFVLGSISLNGESVLDAGHFDESRSAFFVDMPDANSILEVVYEKAEIRMKDTVDTFRQVSQNDELNVSDYVDLYIGDKPSENVKWMILDTQDKEVLDYEDASQKVLRATGEGKALICACVEDYQTICVPFIVEVLGGAQDVLNLDNTGAEGVQLGSDPEGDPDRIVGRLTILARRSSKDEFVPHGSTVFTPYEDVTLNISYYEYYKPTQKYLDLIADYVNNPGNYDSDPALYQEGLQLENRNEDYFTSIGTHQAKAPAAPVTLKKGETISMSSYQYGQNHYELTVDMLEDSSLRLESGEEVQEMVNTLLEKWEDFENNGRRFENIEDGAAAFDSFFGVLICAYQTVLETGKNPLDGQSEGGLNINTEMYNQFRRDDSQLPNNYYTIEITAKELAAMEAYLSNPENNYYSILTKNCTSGATDIWNAALFDKPSLWLKGNFTGLIDEGDSLYVEIGLLRLKCWIPGEGGADFYPHYDKSAFVESAADEAVGIGTQNGDPTGAIDPLKVLNVDNTAIELAAAKGVAAGYIGSLSLKYSQTISDMQGISETKKSSAKEELTERVKKALTAIAVANTKAAVTSVQDEHEKSLETFMNDLTAKNTGYVRAKNNAALNKGISMSVSSKGVLTLKWGQVSEADGYDLFVRTDAKKITTKITTRVKSGKTVSTTLKKIFGKQVKTNQVFRYMVKAYKIQNGKKVYIAASREYACAGSKAKKVTNVKKLTLNTSKVSLGVGGKFQIKKKCTLSNKNKKLNKYTNKFYYVSSDTNVATVTAKGKVTGREKGTCQIYVIAADGVKKAVQVTVA